MSMALFAVRDALKARQMATPAQIAADLQLPTGTVQDMLAHWVRRRLAAEVASAPEGRSCGSGACNTCGQCAAPSPAQVLYVWQGLGKPQSAPRPVIPLRPAA